MTNQTPIFLLTADGGPFATSRILSIEVTDAAGLESDELTIVLDDTPPQIARPREGALFSLALGYAEWPAPIFMGVYVFEELERDGYERRLTLIAKAADHAKTLKEPKTRAWSETTFGEIIETIAADHELEPIVADTLAPVVIAYMAQTEESDQAFLTRLGKRVGAVIAPKDGRLVATERRSGKTASGEDMPPIFVTANKVIGDGGYRVGIKPRSRFGKVIARWHDAAAGRTRKVEREVADEGPSMTIREVFQNEADATKAAELKAGEGELSVTMVGDPKARAEAPVTVLGVGEDADGAPWIASRVTHLWDYGEDGGATTEVEADYGKPDEDEEKEDEKAAAPKPEDGGEYVSILDRT